MAVSWANMGLSDAALDLPGYPQMTAGEIVEKFGLGPFLESGDALAIVPWWAVRTMNIRLQEHYQGVSDESHADGAR